MLILFVSIIFIIIIIIIFWILACVFSFALFVFNIALFISVFVRMCAYFTGARILYKREHTHTDKE